MTKKKFPQFGPYACVGDSITWEKDGFVITATLHSDNYTHVNDFDCYSPIKVKQWFNNEWFFCGVVLSVSKNGVLIDKNAASLWGIDCNYNKQPNKYLAEVAQSLESEAIEAAKVQLEVMRRALA